MLKLIVLLIINAFVVRSHRISDSQQNDLIFFLSKCNYKVPLHTRVGEFFIQTFLWLLYNQKVCNNQSGIRAFSRNSLKIFTKIKSTKFGLCTETLFEAAYKKLRIAEIPISVNPRRSAVGFAYFFSGAEFFAGLFSR